MIITNSSRLLLVIVLLTFVLPTSIANNLKSDILISEEEIINPEGSVYEWTEWNNWEETLTDQCYTNVDELLSLCKKSIEQLQKIGNRYSKFAIGRAYYLLGSSSFGKEANKYRKKEASVYKSLIRKNPNDVQALFNYALNIQNKVVFRKLLEDILEIDPFMFAALKLLASSYRNSPLKEHQNLGRFYYLKIYEADHMNGIVNVTSAADYYTSLVLDDLSDEARSFRNNVINDLDVETLEKEFNEIDLSDSRTLKMAKEKISVLCDRRLVDRLKYNKSCLDVIKRINQLENPPLDILKSGINAGWIFLSGNFGNLHDLSTEEKLVKMLYTSYLELDESNLEIWYEYAYYFLDDQKRKEVYERLVEAKGSAPKFAWYNLAIIYAKEGNGAEAIEYLQQGLKFMTDGDKIVYQNLIDDISNKKAL